MKRRQLEPGEQEEWAQQLVENGVAANLHLARMMMRNPASWPHADEE